MPTIAQRDVGRSNNFDAIRFVAASMVIVSHSYALLDLKAADPLTRLHAPVDLGSLAVDVFFVISGYLITKSMLRRTSALAYVEARVLRIVPGLIAAGVLGVFVLAPFTAIQGTSAYFTSRETWAYFAVNTLTMYLGTTYGSMPGVYQHTFWPGAINGSLWTLGREVELYVFIFVAGLCATVSRNARLRTAGLAVVFLLVLLGCMWWGRLYLDPDPGNIYRLTAWFMCGALVYLARSRIPVSAGIALGLSLLYVVLHRSPIKGAAF
jgi:peptidoglycan/LPS O-acetylase OafA/YrhL